MADQEFIQILRQLSKLRKGNCVYVGVGSGIIKNEVLLKRNGRGGLCM